MFRTTHTLFNLLLVIITLKVWLLLGFPIDATALCAVGAGFVLGTRLNPDIDLDLRPFLEHRGLTHTPIGAGLAVALFMVLAPPQYQALGILGGLGFGAAWLGHICGDKLSDAVGGLKNDWLLHALIIATITLLGLDILGVMPLSSLIRGG